MLLSCKLTVLAGWITLKIVLLVALLFHYLWYY